VGNNNSDELKKLEKITTTKVIGAETARK